MASMSGQFLVGLENVIVLEPALRTMGTVMFSSVDQDAVRLNTVFVVAPPLTLVYAVNVRP